jgi:hypothetical protein
LEHCCAAHHQILSAGVIGIPSGSTPLFANIDPSSIPHFEHGSNKPKRRSSVERFASKRFNGFLDGTSHLREKRRDLLPQLLKLSFVVAEEHSNPSMRMLDAQTIVRNDDLSI